MRATTVETDYQNAVAEKGELEKFDFVREEESKKLCNHRNARLIACSHSLSRHVERVDWNGSEYIVVSAYCVLCRIAGTSGADHGFDPIPREISRAEFEATQ